jgi:hypothetical protein
VLESILGAVGVTCRVVAMPAAHDPFLHPGRKGFVQVPGEQALGFVGELHPVTARRYGFDDPVVCVELDLDRLCERLGEPPRALPLSEFPPLRQDISVVVPDEHPASSTLRPRDAGGELLGKSVPRRLARRERSARTALAGAGLTFQAPGPHAPTRRCGRSGSHRGAPARAVGAELRS